MTAKATLPALREELSISRDALHKSWMIYDPIRGKFHRVGETAIRALRHWQPVAPDAFLDRINAQEPELNFTEDALTELTEFLLKQKLADPIAGTNAERLAAEEAAQRKPWHEQLIHKYLFFRIPLFQPQEFLNSWGTVVSAAFRPLTAWLLVALGVIGVVFASRQWDQFVSTFLYFFTLQGFIFYGLSLIIIKALHELGHAFAAHHFGARVPVIGVAFLVMFPIMYTDTTDAWHIHDRRARVLISSAGIITELSIAAISIFLWSFLPDGPIRSIAFFAATTSWIMSLAVNLNPWMRFDGYYIISDVVGTENLQERGFAIGRNIMRRTLFGLSEPKAESATGRRLIGFCAYAWTTWVYRFFLFIGIAILVHHIFPKAIGIVLFVIEIGIFIAWPMWREIKFWWSERMSIISQQRGRVTLASSALFVLGMVVPWQTKINAPAIIRPAQQTEVFPVAAGEVLEMRVANGEVVAARQVLAILRSPDVEYRYRRAQLELELATAQWNRQAASTEDRQLRDIWRDQLAEKQAAVKATELELERLFVRAPHAGIISDIPLGLTPGRDVGRTDRLMRIVDPRTVELIALPKEVEAARLQTGAAFTFISDQPGRETLSGRITLISPTAEQVIEEPVLTVFGGGPIAATEDARGDMVADIPVFRVSGQVQALSAPRMDRGVVKIKADASSPAKAIWKNVMKVLLRETDF